MTEVLAVFRSLSQAIDCNARLKAAGICASIVNTPKEANIGCGLSIKLPQNTYGTAKKIIAAGGYSAFYGFLKVQSLYGKIYTGRIG